MFERDAASTESNEHPTTSADSRRPAPSRASDRDPSIRADSDRSRWGATLELRRYRAETERLRVLVDFLSRPIHLPAGTDPDLDVMAAYNLAVEAALQGLRRASRFD
ncbi:MAG: hypothetical protein SFX72_01120 [Isosphaeraceae bacterium]|nr:hypothetical protein [Isosphaeraceae bacterium]